MLIWGRLSRPFCLALPSAGDVRRWVCDAVSCHQVRPAIQAQIDGDYLLEIEQETSPDPLDVGRRLYWISSGTKVCTEDCSDHILLRSIKQHPGSIYVYKGDSQKERGRNHAISQQLSKAAPGTNISQGLAIKT